MAIINETEIQNGKKDEECSFKWVENSQLYYHASSGFYHDPNAGWYYSSRDGLYYKFENGNYMLLESDRDDLLEVYTCADTVPDNSTRDESCIPSSSHKNVNYSWFREGESEAYDLEIVPDDPNNGNTECMNSELPVNPPPPSEWLEDTLIELYLSGYSKQAMDADCDTRTASDERMPEETICRDSLSFSVDGAGNDDAHELEGGEWILDENDSSNNVLDEGAYQDEENWRAQYGQVIKPTEESVTDFRVVDLWDWAMVRGTKKNGKEEVARLVGRLVRRSVKLHPSMPSGGGLMKTVPICEAHLDLVRVTSGQVYKLRTPSSGYLPSLQTYDSSNPTKDWGFPELSRERTIQKLSKLSGNSESKLIEGIPDPKDALSPEQLSISQKNRNQAYRDRAAERRALHGGFGVGPGQKRSAFAVDSTPSSPVSACSEEAAAESLNTSFGPGSYARRILERMGWLEGEALGNSVKGLTEPLQAVGNKGGAGLGWDHSRSKHP